MGAVQQVLLSQKIAAAGNGLLSGLTAFWAIDEASGNRADLGPNGITLTDTNTVLSATGIVYALAGDFEASASEYLVSNSANAVHAGTHMSLIAWVKGESFTDFNGVIGSSNSNTFSLVYRDATRWRFITGSTQQDLTVAAINTGQWYMLFAAFDSVVDFTYMSVNGAAKTASADTSTKNTAAANIEIGRNAPLAGNYWDGLIGPVAMWDRILSDADISALYNGGSGLPYASFTA